MEGWADGTHVNATCPCPHLCCMAMSMPHVHVPAACSRTYRMFWSMLHVNVVCPCPCCISISPFCVLCCIYVHAGSTCCMSMPHIPAFCLWYFSMLHGDAACPCPCCISILCFMPLVHAACPFCMSMPIPHVHVHAPCLCRDSPRPVHHKKKLNFHRSKRIKL